MGETLGTLSGMQEMVAGFFFVLFIYKEDKLGLIKKVLSHFLLFLSEKDFRKVFDSTEGKTK